MLFFKSFLYKLKRGCSKNDHAVGTSLLTDQNNIASKCRWTVLSPYWKPVHRDWRGESSVNSCLTGMKAGAQISRHLGMAAWQLIPVFGKWRCRGHRARQLSKLSWQLWDHVRNSASKCMVGGGEWSIKTWKSTSGLYIYILCTCTTHMPTLVQTQHACEHMRVRTCAHTLHILANISVKFSIQSDQCF